MLFIFPFICCLLLQKKIQHLMTCIQVALPPVLSHAVHDAAKQKSENAGRFWVVTDKALFLLHWTGLFKTR